MTEEKHSVQEKYDAIVRLNKDARGLPPAQHKQNLAQALQLILALQKEMPPHYGIFFQLGMNYYYQENFEAAILELQKASQFEPRFNGLFWHIGLSHLALKNFPAAIANFKKCASLIPPDQPNNHIAVQRELAISYLHAGNIQQGATILYQLEKAGKMDIKTMLRTADIYFEQREYGAAARQFRIIANSMASINGNASVEILLKLIEALRGNNQALAAREVIVKLRNNLQNEHPELYNQYSGRITLLEIDILRDAHYYQEALALCDKLLSTTPFAGPALATIYTKKGGIYAIMGDREAALAQTQSALMADQNFQTAWMQRTRLIHYTKDTAHKDLSFLNRLANNPQIPPLQRSHLAMALGKIYHDIGITKPAFAYFQRGNQALNVRYKYDMRHTVKMFQNMKNIFANITPADSVDTAYEDKRELIFVLGMPRSGTSLAEQILATHSRVYGGGELNYMNQETDGLYQWLRHNPDKQINKTAFQSIGQAYLRHLHTLDNRHPVVTDKLPHNFFLLGYILSAFPTAKIVHLQRDAVAVCWSHYRHRFKSKMMDYSYNLQNLGHYYRLYSDLMDYWRKKFPDRIYDLGYENLTQEPEAQMRKLLDYCALDWQDEVLDFHKTNRPLHTASQLQVKQKIYRGSSQKWRDYKDELQPLAKALSENPYDIYGNA